MSPGAPGSRDQRCVKSSRPAERRPSGETQSAARHAFHASDSEPLQVSRAPTTPLIRVLSRERAMHVKLVLPLNQGRVKAQRPLSLSANGCECARLTSTSNGVAGRAPDTPTPDSMRAQVCAFVRVAPSSLSRSSSSSTSRSRSSPSQYCGSSELTAAQRSPRSRPSLDWPLARMTRPCSSAGATKSIAAAAADPHRSGNGPLTQWRSRERTRRSGRGAAARVGSAGRPPRPLDRRSACTDRPSSF